LTIQYRIGNTNYDPLFSRLKKRSLKNVFSNRSKTVKEENQAMKYGMEMDDLSRKSSGSKLWGPSGTSTTNDTLHPGAIKFGMEMDDLSRKSSGSKLWGPSGISTNNTLHPGAMEYGMEMDDLSRKSSGSKLWGPSGISTNNTLHPGAMEMDDLSQKSSGTQLWSTSGISTNDTLHPGDAEEPPTLECCSCCKPCYVTTTTTKVIYIKIWLSPYVVCLFVFTRPGGTHDRCFQPVTRFLPSLGQNPPRHNGGNDRFCARLKVLLFSLKYEWQFWSKFYHLQKKKFLEEIKFFLIQL
jgi:hypothetical protein